MSLRLLLLLFLYIGMTPGSNGQIHPAEGSKLNYTLVPFQVPVKKNALKYTLKVAQGIYGKQKTFDKNIILSISDTQSLILVELPAFGKSYTWQIAYDDLDRSPLYHFSTNWSPIVDSTRSRLRILESSYANKNILFFLDYSRSLYNMEGRKVWYLPNIAPYVDSNSRIRDLKMSPFGTITFLTDTGAYEIDYNANLLWKAPDSAQKGLYNHHELTRLGNGNYMTLGLENVLKKVPSDSITLAANKDVIKKEDGYYKLITFSTIVEYDTKGKVVWKWNSSDYFNGQNLEKLRLGNGMLLPTIRMNGFFINEEKKIVYTGFRDISTILKIKYPEGTLLNAYGEGYANTPHKLFVGQHAYSINKKGNLLLYNNNSITRDDDEISAILVLKEPESITDTLKKVWEYICQIDVEAPHTGHREGNVVELQDGTMLVNMGTSHRVFIVSMDKKLLFNAVSEKWDVNESKWVPFPNYRVGVVNKSQLIERQYRGLVIPLTTH